MINDINKLGNNRQVTGSDSRNKPAAQENTSAPSKAKPVGKEQVQLSDQAKQLSSLKQAIINAPDNPNTAKIESIKQQLSDGTYQVDAKTIAQKIVQEQSID